MLRLISLDERFNWVPPAVGTAFLSGSSFSFLLASPGSPTRGRGLIRGDGSTATERPLRWPPLHFSAVTGFHAPGYRGRAALDSDSLNGAACRRSASRRVVSQPSRPAPAVATFRLPRRGSLLRGRFMLHVSTPAAARMAHLLGARPENAVLRIVCRKQRLRLRLGTVHPGDQTFVHEGRVVLALDERIGTTLSLRQLELRQTDAGPRLRLKRSQR